MERIISVPNNQRGLKIIKLLKQQAKLDGYTIRVRGRCIKRRQVFARTGRVYSTYAANSNDIAMKSKEARFCHSWVVYSEKKQTLDF